jgi:hypothetical protein
VPEAGWTNASLIEGFAVASQVVEADVTRFDTYCRLNRVDHVDLVKIDAEGSEPQVLRGMGDLIDDWAPDIICEVLAPFAEEIDAFFQRRPYQRFLIRDDGLQPSAQIFADSTFRNWYLTTRATTVCA